jgi:hypothetical protein
MNFYYMFIIQGDFVEKNEKDDLLYYIFSSFK